MKKVLMLGALAWIAALPAAAPVAAQDVVSTVPVSTRQRAFTAQATASTFTVRNVGQTCHTVFFSWTTGATVVNFTLTIEGSTDGVTWQPISDVGTPTVNSFTSSTNLRGTVFGTGFFSIVRINLANLSGGAGATVTADYVGTSGCQPPVGSAFNKAQPLMLPVFVNQRLDTSQDATIYTPTGNSMGTLLYSAVAGANPGGCIISVVARYPGTGSRQVASITLPTPVSVPYAFPIQAAPAMYIDIQFTGPCGGANETFNLYYVFYPTSALAKRTSSPTTPSFANGGTIEEDFVCDQSAEIQFTAGGAGNNQIIALAANQRIRVCHISFTTSAAIGVQFTQGTGVNCAAGTANISGIYTNVSTLALDLGAAGAFRTASGSALCINVGAAATVGGLVTFARY